jgi:hypothetical protein
MSEIGVRRGVVGWGTEGKPEGRCFNSGWGHWGFSMTGTSSRNTAQGSTQPVTEMSTNGISWGVKAAGA